MDDARKVVTIIRERPAREIADGSSTLRRGRKEDFSSATRRKALARKSKKAAVAAVAEPPARDPVPQFPGRMAFARAARNITTDVMAAPVTCTRITPAVVIPSGTTSYAFDPLRPRDIVLRNTGTFTLNLSPDPVRIDHAIRTAMASGRTIEDDRFAAKDVAMISGRHRVFFHAGGDLRVNMLSKSWRFVSSPDELFPLVRSPHLEHEGQSPVDGGSIEYVSRSWAEDGQQTGRQGRIPMGTGPSRNQELYFGPRAQIFPDAGTRAIIDLVWTIKADITYVIKRNEHGDPVDENGELAIDPATWVADTEPYDPRVGRPIYLSNGLRVSEPADPTGQKQLQPKYTAVLTPDVKAFSTRYAHKTGRLLVEGGSWV